ncbi:MAG TPA: HYR domain-containing protein [Pyrinomonadaceae bacterium]|jgi:hypothetical protein
MKTKRTLIIATVLVALPMLTAFAVLPKTQPVEARTVSANHVMQVDPTPTPGPESYSVLPSDTDGPQNDGSDPCDGQTGAGIGCDQPDEWGKHAINEEHLLYLPTMLTNTGKLLVFLNGDDGSATRTNGVPVVAAERGYHVIQLTYPTAKANGCSDLSNHQDALDCFGDAFREAVTGEENPDSNLTTIGDHPQDSIMNRLLRVLQWADADANYPNDGWGKYLVNHDAVDWTKVHLAGFSNGSSHVSYMGTMPEFQSVKRIALLAGPNDGVGGTAEEWDSASYIRLIPGITDTRYYGLVHRLNKADKPDSNGQPPAYQVYKNWHKFGMEDPVNRPRFEFDPGEPGVPEDFDGAHMLVSIDPERLQASDMPPPPWGTTKEEAHISVGRNRYCTEIGDDLDTTDEIEHKCLRWGDESIGYEPAWRCILGTGDISLSSAPIADAGPNQTVECEGGGGANVNLDGSGTRDLDCGVLTYTWTGSFVAATGRKPTVFLPVGTHLVNLEVKDEWNWSDSKTVLITVQDTEPPTISCPADIVVEPTCSSGAVVTYTAPVGADTCTEAFTTQTAGLASGSIFPIGTTTVTYTATDASNNTASCSFTVKVLTAAEVIQNLISRVQALQPPLSGQQAQGLRSKLNAALVAIESGQKNVACNKLNDFISQVQTYINNGKLTSAQGQPLIDSAAHVRNTLGCTALGCT